MLTQSDVARIMRKDLQPTVEALTSPLFHRLDSANGHFFSGSTRNAVRRLVDEQLPLVFKIENTYSYKVGNAVVDVWDFGHKDVVFILTVARVGGLIAMFDDKQDVEKQHQQYLDAQALKQKRQVLRDRAVDLLKQNGYTDKDILALGWEM